jgi:hypothetical protein
MIITIIKKKRKFDEKLEERETDYLNKKINEIDIDILRKSSKSSQSSPLKADTYYYSNNNEIESSIDFILSHFEQPIFPRNISTYKSQQNRPFQFTLRSRQKKFF